MTDSSDVPVGDSPGVSVSWVADTGLFVACGRQQNDKYRALERFARRNDVRFAIPRRVRDELGGAPTRSTPGQSPIERAIHDGWVTVAAEPDYANGTVSRVMDDVRTYIATRSNRDEDRIEKADTALAAVAAELLRKPDTDRVTVVTTDLDAGNGVVTALETNGFADRVRFVNGFEFLEEIT